MNMVGIGEFKIQESGEIGIPALGSCIAIALYARDQNCTLASLGHIFLPYSKNRPDHGAKYADTGIRNMLEALLEKGVKRENVIAKISGGANMFASNNGTEAVGSLNIKAVKETLMALNINLVAEDVGGTRGRKITFRVISKELQIHYVKAAEEVVI